MWWSDRGSALIHVVHGTVRPPRSSPLAVRLHCLYRALAQVIEEHRPDAVAIEQVFVASSPRAALVLGQARGAVLAAVAAGGLPVSEYTPSQIKQGVAGSGAAAKPQVQAMVRRILGLERAPARRRRRAGRRDPACARAAARRARRDRPPRGARASRGRFAVRGEARAVIARLEGVLREQGPTRVIVDVGGVGYAVQIPLSTFTELPDEGKIVALHVHTHASEGAIQLFGFATRAELVAFELLLRASRVGPRLAQTILSGITPAALLEAIRGARIATLRAVPGVGAKLAERILLELRDRVDELALAVAGAAAPGAARRAASDPAAREQTLSALVNLGYPRSQAERVVEEAASEAGDSATLETLVRGVSQEVGAMKQAAGERGPDRRRGAARGIAASRSGCDRARSTR